MATGHEASAQDAESDYRPFWLRPGLFLTLGLVFTVVATMSAVTAPPASLPAFAPFLIVAILIYWGAVYALVRSLRLAALAAGAVFLAFLWALGILALARIALTPTVIAAVLAVNIVGATAIAQELYGFLTDTCRGMLPVSAAHKAVRQWARPALAGLFTALASVVVFASFAQESLAVVIAVGWVAAVAMAPLMIAIVPALVSLTRFDEIFVVRANRVRETRENWMVSLAGFTVLRWALAILGITVVLSVIVFFDGGRVPANPSTVLLLWAEAGPALGAVFVVGGLLSALGVGDLRAFFSCAMPAFLMSTLAAWASLHLGMAGPAPLAGLLVLGAGAGTGIGCIFAAGIAVYRRFGDDVATAFARALNDCGLVVLSVGVSGLLAAALFGGRYTLAWPAALTIAAELVGILVLLPVLTAILDDVLPRRRSVEELYGAG